ncbi:SusC/RagA family TonB-linked outer membrane protein [Mongoliitalea daihaiensis]|uniref:SusC/RagA family TonB-linked outer membrane protein n=1 Tax=Mongoliitalea daihaiensis TaxID=2782006 RepID=UPI001F28F6FC|nr:SusC/RagA family TonB-linked outer membrane protein [Mongoliitalea daihaiensis]UJP63252.1 SusC/RagA family TonB-linked outer membrane protein [Mongoliitalea daihaiensis]
MSRLLLLVFTLIISLTFSLETYAQTRVLTGTVVDSSGEPIPGVNILEKRSNSGTTTDLDGKYSISVTNNTVLVFSFIGFSVQEVLIGNRSTLDVTLSEDLSELSEVVVTSFGMEKDKKALGFSVTQIGGEKFTESRAINLGNALTGKIAGVNVSPPASGAAGSTRVVIRGGSSLTGNDQPLYVVNGMPIETGNLGSAGMWGGNDGGDGLASINPDDIESISVLKGNAAAALYGARAANGVVLITTKSGKARKGIGVSLNSNITFDRAWDLTDYQREFGPGRDGVRPLTADEAIEIGQGHWGPRYDGVPSLQFDGVSRPFSHTGEGINDFYRTGMTINNSVALSGGNEKATYRFAYSDLHNQDVMPNSGFKRRVLNVNINSKLGEKLTLDFSGQYSNQDAQNRPRLSDSPGNANFSVFNRPGNVPFSALRGPGDKLGANEDLLELRYQQNVFQTNPYWAAHQFSRSDVTDRVLGQVTLKYDITDWLYIMGRAGTDYQARTDNAYEPWGTAYRPRGSYNLTKLTLREDNLDLFIGGQKDFGNFSVDAMVGANRMRRSTEALSGGGNDLVVPFFHSVRNVAEPVVGYNFSEWGINSIFGSANFGYKNFLFLNLTARQDQFSTLAPENSKLFYPSVGTSFVLSDVIDMPKAITFTKFRASWGQTGGGAPMPYALNLNYGLVGAGHLGGSLGQINNGSIPNNALQPYLSTEYEIGGDFRFLDNRIGLDFAFYNRNTTNDILATGISATSGFNSTIVNIGELRNRGVELLLNITAIRNKDFQWDFSLNYANNQSMVLSLGNDAEGDPIEFINLDESRLRRERIRHIVGQPLGMIAGFKHQTINGQKVYDDDGLPVWTDGLETIAEARHPVSAGLANNFSYKGFRLMVLLDMRYGGSLVSGTNFFAYSNGLHQETLVGRDGGLTVSGVDRNGEARTWEIPAVTGDPNNYWLNNYYTRYAQVTENIVYDASFIQLRELSFGYTIPRNLLAKTPFESASISLVGRNLALLWSNVPNIHPESAYTVSGNAQGLEFFAMPVARNFGFNINVNF